MLSTPLQMYVQNVLNNLKILQEEIIIFVTSAWRKNLSSVRFVNTGPNESMIYKFTLVLVICVTTLFKDYYLRDGLNCIEKFFYKYKLVQHLRNMTVHLAKNNYSNKKYKFLIKMQ